MGGKADRRCSLVAFFGQEAEDKFAHAKEVDHLCNAKKRCDDQGSTVGSLQEGRRALVAHDFPRERTQTGHFNQNVHRALVMTTQAASHVL